MLNLFDEPTGLLESARDQRLIDLGLPHTGGDKHKQIHWHDMQADLFLCTPETWAMNTTIRTGSKDFTQWLMTPRRQGGAMHAGMYSKDAQLWDGDVPLHLEEELDVFGAMGLVWIPPEERIEGRWKR